MSLLFDYMCVRLPFIPWSIAGVPSSQVLPGFLLTAAPPSVCDPAVIGALAEWIQNQKKTTVTLKINGNELNHLKHIQKTRMQRYISVSSNTPQCEGSVRRACGGCMRSLHLRPVRSWSCMPCRRMRQLVEVGTSATVARSFHLKQ